jgi:hypothetical protein
MEPTECRSEVEHLLAFLDPMHDYICWLADGLNTYDSAAQMRVIRRIAVMGQSQDEARHERRGAGGTLRMVCKAAGIARLSPASSE